MPFFLSTKKAATDRQLAYLAELGVDVPDGQVLSRRDASDLISRALRARPATEAQLRVMREHQIDFPDGVDREAASRLIEERFGGAPRFQVKRVDGLRYDWQAEGVFVSVAEGTRAFKRWIRARAIPAEMRGAVVKMLRNHFEYEREAAAGLLVNEVYIGRHGAQFGICVPRAAGGEPWAPSYRWMLDPMSRQES